MLCARGSIIRARASFKETGFPLPGAETPGRASILLRGKSFSWSSSLLLGELLGELFARD